MLEDDAVLSRRLVAYLRGAGADVSVAARLDEARRLAAETRFDFALLDLHLPDGEALALLRDNIFSENTGVVVMTAFGGVKAAVEAMRRGAGDYLAKPFELDELPLAFQRCRLERRDSRREQIRNAQAAGASRDFFFGESLHDVRAQLEQVLAAERELAHHLPPLLVEGETGTGKSILARWVHACGARAAAPFLVVNCSTLPETLADSELFGNERGAFTDAKQARLGIFEAADGGTLFLDEIGSLSAAAQAKLLLAVEEHVIRRVGATKSIPVDVRIVAATNRPLAELVRAGAFREDLYHRLNLVRVELPPLRRWQQDLGALADHLLAGLRARYRRPQLELSPKAHERLRNYAWPGNIRELAHELERAVIFSGASDHIELAHLEVAPSMPKSGWRNPDWRLPESGFSLESVEAELVAEAMRATDQNVSAAARRLGVTREFLRYRLGEKTRAE